MNWRAVAARAFALGFLSGLSYSQWRITSPGEITFTEWRIALLAGAVALIVTLSATWVGNGRPPVDTPRDTYTQSDNRRVIRPPWS